MRINAINLTTLKINNAEKNNQQTQSQIIQRNDSDLILKNLDALSMQNIAFAKKRFLPSFSIEEFTKKGGEISKTDTQHGIKYTARLNNKPFSGTIISDGRFSHYDKWEDAYNKGFLVKKTGYRNGKRYNVEKFEKGISKSTTFLREDGKTPFFKRERIENSPATYYDEKGKPTHKEIIKNGKYVSIPI